LKKLFLVAATLFVLIVVNFLIIKKEITLAGGRTMLLRLAPVDPRSLIQGDYMILRYSIAGSIPEKQLADKGCIVVSLDGNSVAKFVRVHKGEPLRNGEHLLFYRNRRGPRFGAESFFFQEGDAKLYANARYAELKVDSSGKSVLVGLRGEDFRVLGRNSLHPAP